MQSLSKFTRLVLSVIENNISVLPDGKTFDGMGNVFIHGSSLYDKTSDSNYNVIAKDIDLFFGREYAELLDSNAGSVFYIDEKGISINVSIEHDKSILVQVETNDNMPYILKYDYKSSYNDDMLKKLENDPIVYAKYVTGNTMGLETQVKVMDMEGIEDYVDQDFNDDSGKLLFISNEDLKEVNVNGYRYLSFSPIDYADPFTASIFEVFVINRAISRIAKPNERILIPQDKPNLLAFVIHKNDVDPILKASSLGFIDSLKTRINTN